MATFAGNTLTRADLAEGVTVLAFVVPGTPSCDTVLPQFRDVGEGVPEARWLLLVPEVNDAARAAAEALGPDWTVVADESLLLASVFQIYRVPALIGVIDGAQRGFLGWEFDADALSSWIVGLVDRAAQSDAGDGEESPPDPSGPSLLGEAIGFHRLPAPLILAFAGAHCPMCHQMLPELFAIAEEHTVWLAITGDPEGDLEAFESDAAKLWMLLDPEWSFAHLFDVHTTPTVLFVQTDGSLAWGHVGVIRGLAGAVDAFLTEEGATAP
jgi:hypothetical protein